MVNGARTIRVAFSDGVSSDADLLGEDADTDLAVLRIDATNLPAVVLGSSGALRVGQMAIAIGNPYGFQHTVTAGVVSALGRSLRASSGRLIEDVELAVESGVRAGTLEAGGPVIRAGVEPGDIIVGFAGVPVASIDDLHRLLSVDRVGKQEYLEVLRRGRRLAMKVEPAERVTG